MQSLYVVEGRLEKVQYSYAEMRQLFLQTQGTLPEFAGLMYTGAQMHMGQFFEAQGAFEEIISSQNEEQVKDLQASQGVNYLAHGMCGSPITSGFWAFQKLLYSHGRRPNCQQNAQPFNQALTVTYLAMLQELRPILNFEPRQKRH